jgi:hypothetical protein
MVPLIFPVVPAEAAEVSSNTTNNKQYKLFIEKTPS